MTVVASVGLRSDHPIDDPSKDAFGRLPLAKLIAAEAMGAPPRSGFVIALCGDWGSGKTSVANMAIAELKDRAQILSFNPWLYSGADDLIDRFFGQLIAVLGRGDETARRAALKMSRYAGAVSSVARVVPGLGSISAGAAAAERLLSLLGEAQSLDDIRDELVYALLQLDHRILVVIDDVDRLADDEVRDIVRLVKLVGDLPNVTYLLCFDRDRVEEILGRPVEQEKASARGRAYLEKIVQIPHDLPAPRSAQLAEFLRVGLNEILAGRDIGVIHEHGFQNLLALGIRPMLRTPRDATRIINAIPAALALHGGEIAIVDLIGLETLRVLEPDVYRGLLDATDALVGSLEAILEDEARRGERRREQVDTLLGPARQLGAARQVLAQLFPGAHVELGGLSRGRQEFAIERRDRRAAIGEVFRRYLYGSPDPGAAETDVVRRLADLLDDPTAFAGALDDLPDATLPDVIERLHDFSDRFDSADAEGIAKVLLDLEPRLSDDTGRISTFGSPTRWRWESLVGMLLSVETDKARRQAAILRLADESRTLTGRLRLLNWYGTHPDRSEREPADLELLDADATRVANDELRRRVAEAEPKHLAKEPELRLLVLGLLHPDPAAGRLSIVEKAKDDTFMLALLAASVDYERRHIVGEAVGHSWPVLNWEQLLDLLGEDVLSQRLAELETNDGPGHEQLAAAEAQALKIAMQVHRGERPRRSDLR